MGSISILSTREKEQPVRSLHEMDLFNLGMPCTGYHTLNEWNITYRHLDELQAGSQTESANRSNFIFHAKLLSNSRKLRGNFGFHFISSWSRHASVTTQRKLGNQAISPKRALGIWEECPGMDSERNIYLSLFHPQRVTIEEKLILSDLQ